MIKKKKKLKNPAFVHLEKMNLRNRITIFRPHILDIHESLFDNISCWKLEARHNDEFVTDRKVFLTSNTT